MKKALLKAFGRCRVIDVAMAEASLDITEKELEEYVEQKWLARERVQEENDFRVCYALTEKGEALLRNECESFGEIYRGFILEHDLRLMAFYLERTETERESWMTRDDMTKQYKFPGTVDGAFINTTGRLEGVEVISKKSKPSAVEKNEAFVKHAGIKEMNYFLY